MNRIIGCYHSVLRPTEHFFTLSRYFHRLNPTFISRARVVPFIRSVNTDFFCFVGMHHFARIRRNPVFLYFSTEASRGKARNFGFEQRRWRERKRDRAKKLYQINITIWCVKPIAINAHTKRELLPSSIQPYCPLNLLNSIENGTFHWCRFVEHTPSHRSTKATAASQRTNKQQEWKRREKNLKRQKEKDKQKYTKITCTLSVSLSLSLGSCIDCCKNKPKPKINTKRKHKHWKWAWKFQRFRHIPKQTKTLSRSLFGSHVELTQRDAITVANDFATMKKTFAIDLRCSDKEKNGIVTHSFGAKKTRMRDTKIHNKTECELASATVKNNVLTHAHTISETNQEEKRRKQENEWQHYDSRSQQRAHKSTQDRRASKALIESREEEKKREKARVIRSRRMYSPFVWSDSHKRFAQIVWATKRAVRIKNALIYWRVFVFSNLCIYCFAAALKSKCDTF